MKTETYDYTLTTAKSVLLMVICCAIALGAAYAAVINTRGLGVLGFQISPQGATTAYVMVAIFAGWIAVTEFVSYLRPKVETLPIILDQDAITAPPSPDIARTLRLTYKGISDIKSRAVAGNRVLEIKHIEGNICISGAAMESKDAFDRLWKSLESRVGLHRGYRY